MKYQAPAAWIRYKESPGKVANPMSVYFASLFDRPEEGIQITEIFCSLLTDWVKANKHHLIYRLPLNKMLISGEIQS